MIFVELDGHLDAATESLLESVSHWSQTAPTGHSCQSGNVTLGRLVPAEIIKLEQIAKCFRPIFLINQRQVIEQEM